MVIVMALATAMTVSPIAPIMMAIIGPEIEIDAIVMPTAPTIGHHHAASRDRQRHKAQRHHQK